MENIIHKVFGEEKERLLNMCVGYEEITKKFLNNNSSAVYRDPLLLIMMCLDGDISDGPIFYRRWAEEDHMDNELIVMNNIVRSTKNKLIMYEQNK